MALTYASDTSGNVDATSIVYTKPSGLAAGDYMFAQLCVEETGLTITPASGFTTLEQYDDGVNFEHVVFYKIADAGDVAAANFTFTISGGSNRSIAGGLARVTSSTTTALTLASGEQGVTTSNNATVSIANSITPPSSSNDFLLFFFVGVFSVSAAETASAYAITNDNPTWTEQWDEITTGEVSAHLATAPRSAETATGDSSVNVGNQGNSKTVSAFMVCLAETIDSNTSPVVISVASIVQEPTLSGTASISPAVVSTAVSVQDPTVTTPADTWTKQAKNTTTWTTQDKS